MNTPHLPSIELIHGNSPPDSGDARQAGRGRRWKVFFAVLLIALLIGIALVYSRPAVYRATASILTVKPKAVDTRSAEADLEHVAIQGRMLLGDALLGRLADQLAATGQQDVAGLEPLRGMLSVEPVPDTNLLELRAEGSEPEQLQNVVNGWAESYEAFRAREIEAATGRTTAELEDRQSALQLRIDDARAELQAFREAHDIVSLERSENRSLAGLKGLNDSLNKARERLIEARARKLAIDEAMVRGETVIPGEQKAEIARLQLAVQRGKERLADLRERYTQRYLDRDPVLKMLPDELRDMERELQLALKLASGTVRDEAVQAVEAAASSVSALEQQLSDHQREVQLFTDRFKEFKSLEEGLARLDTLFAENQQRLAQIQVGNLKKYPPIQIVEWARVPDRPIHPDYERDLAIAVAVALALALFATWLVEYLGGRPQQATTPPYLGVRVYPGDTGQRLKNPVQEPRLDHRGAVDVAQRTEQLPRMPRELAGVELHAVLDALDPTARAVATLLLCGVSPYELPLLHRACFDDPARQITVNGASERAFTVNDRVWQWIQPILRDWQDSRSALPVVTLNDRLSDAARNRQVTDPDGVTALALWHSYIVFLVRQGIDADVLTGRVGSIPADVQASLAHYAPAGGRQPADSIEFTHPALVQ